jgi:hypothetical protein
MTRFVACHTCKHALQIGGDESEIRYLLGSATSFQCITPLCGGRMQSLSFGELPIEYDYSDLPVKNFFRAIHGFGTGVGDPASLKRLRELLLTQRVVDIVASPIGQPQRVIIKEMILESGVRLHFETSSRGACVYYIEERGPSCREVVENEFATDPTAQSLDTYREEAGRAFETDPCGGNGSEGSYPASGTAKLPNSGGVSTMPEAGSVRTDSSR